MPTIPAAAAENFDAWGDERLAAEFFVTDKHGREVGRFGPRSLVPNAEALAEALASQYEEGEVHEEYIYG